MTPESFGTGAHVDAKPRLTFPIVKGPMKLKAAVSPDCSYQLLEEAFRTVKAGSEVLLYVYNISAPHLFQFLKDALAKGASVRIMYDAMDTRGEELTRLRELNVPIKPAPSKAPRDVFTVCHQKFVVIDGRTVVLGSANWAGTAIPLRRAGDPFRKGNREWLILASHHTVAGWFRDLFNADWDIPDQPESFEMLVVEEIPFLASAGPNVPPEQFRLFSSNTKTDRLLPIVSPDNYFDVVLPMIKAAKKRVLVEQQYLVSGPAAPSVGKLMEAVRGRLDAGVDVRLVSSSVYRESWIKTVKTVEAFGLRDQLRAINLDFFVHCHNKGVIADNQVVVSSTNWSENSIRRAREAGVRIQGKRIVDYFAGVFDLDWRTGQTVDEVEERPVTFTLDTAQPIHPADLREL